MKLYHALAMAAVAVACGARADVSLDAGDPQYDSSFTNSVRWSDKAVPSSDNTYSVTLGADQYLRAPFATNLYDTAQAWTIASTYKEVAAWSGGALTLGSAAAPGWLQIPISCTNLPYYNNRGSTIPSQWYSRITIADLRVANGGLVFPYSDYAGLFGQITLDSTNEVAVKIGGTNPNGRNAAAMLYLGAQLTGDNKQVIRFSNGGASGMKAAVSPFADNSGFKGQMIFDDVRIEDTRCETLNGNRFGGDPGYFMADALYFPNGFTYVLGFAEGTRDGNTPRTIPAAGNGNRGITFKNGGYIGRYMSNLWTVNMPIVGDTLTVDSGIGDTDFGYSGARVLFNKSVKVDTIKFATSRFPRADFGENITDMTHALVVLHGRLNNKGNYTAVGCHGTCRFRVDATAGGCLESRPNNDGTSVGHVIVSSDSVLTNATNSKVIVLSSGAPAYGYDKTAWPICTIPKTLVEKDNIVVWGISSGTAVTHPCEIRTEGDNYVVYVSKASTSFTYVVPTGTEGNTPTSPYNSWETAANDIPTAIAAVTGASSGQGPTILVAPGTYSVSSPIVLEKRIQLRSCDPETGLIDAEHTILDGGYPARTNRIMKLKLAQVAGFTFQHGSTTAANYYNDNATGGGAIDAGGDGWRIRDCIFRENYAINAPGGALGNFSASGYGTWQVTDCLFEDNATLVSGSGGAFGCGTSNGDSCGVGFKNCIFRRNRAATTGGVGYSGRALYFQSCTFQNNDASSGDRGACFTANHSRAYDCVFEQSTQTSSYVNHGNCRYERCVFRNISTGKSGILAQGASATVPLHFRDCVVTNSSMANFLVCQNMGTDILFKQCLFRDNTMNKIADIHTVGYDFDQCSIVSNSFRVTTGGYQRRPCWIRNSIFWGNNYTSGSAYSLERYLQASITNSIVQTTSYAPSKQNAWVRKPGVVSPTDCHLKARAFARDKATTDDWTLTTATDLDGQPRRVDRRGNASTDSARVDLGCYEAQKPVPATGVVFLK